MRATLCCLLVALTGCYGHHALVVSERAPVYAAPRGEQVIGSLPRYHHQPLDDAPEPEARRVSLRFEGRVGWVARPDLRLFDYLDPIWDAGADQRQTVDAELRALELEEVGQDWNPSVVEQVRDGQIEAGFTREQVQVAWGWPPQVEPGAAPGSQRWIYRDRGVRRVRRWIEPFPYGGFYPAFRYVPGYGYAPQAWSPGFYHPRSISLRVPVTIERVVEFDPDGRVVEISRRQLVDDEDDDGDE